VPNKSTFSKKKPANEKDNRVANTKKFGLPHRDLSGGGWGVVFKAKEKSKRDSKFMIAKTVVGPRTKKKNTKSGKKNLGGDKGGTEMKKRNGHPREGEQKKGEYKRPKGEQRGARFKPPKTKDEHRMTGQVGGLGVEQSHEKNPHSPKVILDK